MPAPAGSGTVCILLRKPRRTKFAWSYDTLSGMRCQKVECPFFRFWAYILDILYITRARTQYSVPPHYSFRSRHSAAQAETLVMYLLPALAETLVSLIWAEHLFIRTDGDSSVPELHPAGLAELRPFLCHGSSAGGAIARERRRLLLCQAESRGGRERERDELVIHLLCLFLGK